MSSTLNSTFELTTAQQRLWIEWKKDPESAVYNNSFRFALSGALNVKLLTAALHCLTQRHPALRTCFMEQGGEVSQMVLEELTEQLLVVDLSLTGGESECEQRIAAILFKPFDLTKPPLFSYTLFKLSSTNFVLILKWHHIITDGVSIKNLLRELSATYNALHRALSTHEQFKVTPLSSNIPHILEKEKENRSSAYFNLGLQHWRKRLREYVPTTIPPVAANKCFTNHAINPSSFSRSLKIYKHLSKELTAAVFSFIAQEKVTLFVFLTTAFSVLLHRYTVQDDITIGYSANTKEAKFFHHLGFYVNNLPLRLKIDSNLPFIVMLQNVIKLLNEDKKYAQIPLLEIMKCLGNAANKNVGEAPFNILVNQIAYLFHEIKLVDVEVIPVPILSGWAKFDFSLLFDYYETIFFEFEHNATKYPEWFVDDLANNFITLIQDIIRNPATKIKDLNLLSDVKKKEIVFAWNDTDREMHCYAIMHKFFEKQVQATPQNIALVFDGECITYATLNAMANQVGNYLCARGAKRGDLIGICLYRSFAMVVAILAIIKVGAAYVPLEPDYPEERLQYLIKDAQPTLLITTTEILNKINLLKNDTVLQNDIANGIVDLRRDRLAIAQMKQQNLDVPVEGSDLIYVLYTSGSTGMPKGAMLEHAAIVNRILWMQDYFKLTTSDAVVQKTPFSFDVSGWEFFWPLIVGARLVIAKPDGHKDPFYLHKLLIENKVTTIHFVPSMLRAFIDSVNCQELELAGIKRVICSGESLPYNLQEKFSGQFTSAELYNLYGPTEAAIDVSYCKCADNYFYGIVPIGKPIYNTKLFILDGNFNPVPIGVIGELFISGICLARGYLNNEELTAQKFFSKIIDGKQFRLYKTGDLARFLYDGNIEYVGRNDSQVKIHGVRIELNEIENYLHQFPFIKDSVAITIGDAANKQLALFVTLHDDVAYEKAVQEDKVEKSKNIENIDKDINAEKIRNLLVNFFPQQVVPSINRIKFLKTFPLNTNGKIDRNKLSQLLEIKENSESNQEEHKNDEAVIKYNDTEQKLINIFSTLLKIAMSKISLSSNFFALGGDSLLALNLLATINKVFSVNLNLVDIFKAETLSDLVTLIKKSNITNNESSVKLPYVQLTPLSIEQYDKYLDSMRQETSAINNMVFCFGLDGCLDHEKLRRAVAILLSRHAILTAKLAKVAADLFFKSTKYVELPVQVDCFDREAQNEEHERSKLMELYLNKKVDLFCDDLFFVHVISYRKKRHVLLLFIHHIIADLLTTQIIINELFVIYSHLVNHSSLCLPEAPQYSRYCFEEKSFLQSPLCKQQEKYWLNKLYNQERYIKFSKLDDKLQQNYASNRIVKKVDLNLIDKIYDYAKQQKTTVFIVLLSIFIASLAKVFQQKTFVVGCILSQRKNKELLNMVGLLNNFLLIKGCVRNNISFSEMLKETSDEFINSIANSDLPYSYLRNLINELEGKISDLRAHLFNIFFDYQDEQFHNAQYSIEAIEKLTIFPMPNSSNSKRDISFRVIRGVESSLAIRYRRNFVSEQQAIDLLNVYKELCGQIVADDSYKLR